MVDAFARSGLCRPWLWVLWLALSGCGADNDSVEQASGEFAPHTVDVTLTEGTNLSFDVDFASGTRVLSLQGTLFLLREGSPAQALTDGYYDAREPQLSPDGSRVVFQGYRGGNWDLFVLDLNNREVRALTDDAYDDREPEFSPDGQTIYFSSDRSGSYDVWALDLESQNLRALTEDGGDAYAPSMSHDQRLAYALSEGSRASIVVVEGQRRTTLVEHSGTISGIEWSPQADKLSYQLLNDDGAALRVVFMSSRFDHLVSPRDQDVFPFRAAWQDSNRLAYAADGKVLQRDLTVESAQDWPFSITVTLDRTPYARRVRHYDSEVERIALGLTSPVVSSDGADVYFVALGDIWHWRPDANEARRITDDAAAEHSLDLSPNGDRLLFVGDRGGRLDLYVLDLTSLEATSLGFAGKQVGAPAWSPDGKRVAAFLEVPGNPLAGQLVVVDLESGERRRLLEPMPAQPVTWSRNGMYVATTRLNPYAKRFREGVYELVVLPTTGEGERVIRPLPHNSIVSAALTADDAMTYVHGGRLYRLELDPEFNPLEDGGAITEELTDMPRWSANGEYLVYLSGNTLKRLHRESGELRDITPQLPWRLDSPLTRYILHAGRVFDSTSNDYLLDQDIWVNGDRIERIAAASTRGDTERTVIDMSDKTVVPGLFEMHAHMGEESETQGRVWLAFGITTVRDPGSNPYTAKARQEAWDSGRRVGPRTHVTGYLTDGNRVYYAMAEGIVDEVHLDMALQRTADLQLDFIKTYVRLADERQKRVVDFAHGIGIPVSSHEIYPAVAHGMDHVEHIGGTSRRGYQPKVSRIGRSYQDVVALLSASGMGITATAVLPGFAVIVQDEPDWFDTPQFMHFYGERMKQAYRSMIGRFGSTARRTSDNNRAFLSRLSEEGALLVTGTDSPFVPYGAGLHAELRLYDRAGIPAAQILRQATIRSAKAAGVAAELGTLEAGKLADMVVIDGDPLADIRDLDNVVMTIKNGRRYALEDLLY